MSPNNRGYFFSLTVFSMLFLLLFFILSCYNRLAADDLYYLANYSETGVWGCMYDLYIAYSGRWSAYLLTGWMVSMNGFKGYHLVFNCFTISSLIAILYLLFKKCAEKFDYGVSRKIILLYAVILTAGLFFTSYSIGETWFWLVQVCTYLWSIIMSLVMLYGLTASRIKPVAVFLIIIPALFIGGASESYALVNIFLLMSYLLLANVKIKNPLLCLVKDRTLNIKIIIALFFLIAGFTLTMLAPGNAVRHEALPKATAIHLIWVQVKSFIKIIFIRTPLHLPYLVLFGFPWLVLGKHLSVKGEKINFNSLLRSFRPYFLIALCLVFIFLIPTSFIMVELGPDRSLSLTSFFITFCFAAACFITGTKIEISDKIFGPLKTIFMLFSIVTMLYHITNQYALTKSYANAYDNRIDLLKKAAAQGQKEAVAVTPLPLPGMLYTGEIATDTSHFTNRFLKRALKLPFPVKKQALPLTDE